MARTSINLSLRSIHRFVYPSTPCGARPNFLLLYYRYHALSFYSASLFVMALLTRFFGNFSRLAQSVMVCRALFFTTTARSYLDFTMETNYRTAWKQVELRRPGWIHRYWHHFSPNWIYTAHSTHHHRNYLLTCLHCKWFCLVPLLDCSATRYYRSIYFRPRYLNHTII